MPKATDDNIHIPPQEKPTSDDGYFSIITKAVFQAGFSWKVVHDKWPGFETAFDNFSVAKVAAYDDRDIERLVSDESIIRNGRKIEGTLHNARVMRDLSAQHGSFHSYLRSLDGLSYPERSSTLTKQFKWLGKTGTYFFLWSVAEDVPDWEER